MNGLHVAPANEGAVRHACRLWHYTGALPTPPRVGFGAWEDGRFVGVVVFSRGASPNIGRPYGLLQTEVAEITRVALRAHRAEVSRIVTVAVRLLRRSSRDLRLLVSYADPEAGHHGGIYQAMNWTYLGQGPPTTVYIDRNGRRWHSRMVSSDGWRTVYGRRRRVLRYDECERLVVAGKHRYALALDPALRPQLDERAQPYPKRAAAPMGAPQPPAGDRRFDSDPAALQEAAGAAV